MAFEPSEVFCAAALCFNKTYLKNTLRLSGPQGPGSPSDRIDRFLLFFKEAEKVASGNEVVFAENRQAFLNFFKVIPVAHPKSSIGSSAWRLSNAQANDHSIVFS